MSKPQIRFTKHALGKFNTLKRYGFILNKQQVIKTLIKPDRLDQKVRQHFATQLLDENYALRVVYEKHGEQFVIITFYPVRRDRYGV